MPAIQPARLKIQATELTQHAGNPAEFCRAYHEFLENFADRTYRPGQVGEPPPLIRAYQVPAPVLPAVEKELNQYTKDNREQSLELADALWAEPFLEFRLLAASVVGQVSPKPFRSVIERIESWVEARTEERLLKALVYLGLERFLQEYPDSYLQQIENWFSSEVNHISRLGLKAIPPLLESGTFEDYPQLFNQLSKLMRGERNPLKADILGIIEVLAYQSPDETAYFLGQTKISAGENTTISWYIRNSMGFFPPDSQRYLREILLDE
jgi:hypothetical protein